MVTNCVNCVAPIDPSLDKCPYCGTSYEAMGVKNDAVYELKTSSFNLQTAEFQKAMNEAVIHSIIMRNEARRWTGLRDV